MVAEMQSETFKHNLRVALNNETSFCQISDRISRILVMHKSSRLLTSHQHYKLDELHLERTWHPFVVSDKTKRKSITGRHVSTPPPLSPPPPPPSSSSEEKSDYTGLYISQVHT